MKLALLGTGMIVTEVLPVLTTIAVSYTHLEGLADKEVFSAKIIEK